MHFKSKRNSPVFGLTDLDNAVVAGFPPACLFVIRTTFVLAVVRFLRKSW